jgi:hypothetical protein
MSPYEQESFPLYFAVESLAPKSVPGTEKSQYLFNEASQNQITHYKKSLSIMYLCSLSHTLIGLIFLVIGLFI